MKELKVVLLVLAIGFGNSVPAISNCPDIYYPNTIKGGIQTKQHQLKEIAGLGIDGKYEYYLQYLKYKTDYRKNEEDQIPKNPGLNAGCIFKDTLNIS